jgi:hypothetical protein
MSWAGANREHECRCKQNGCDHNRGADGRVEPVEAAVVDAYDDGMF